MSDHDLIWLAFTFLLVAVVSLGVAHNAAVADFGRRIRAIEKELERMTGKEFL